MIEIWQHEHPIIRHELNKTFHEVRLMSDGKFHDWSEGVRVFLGKRWEQDGIPPQNGITLDRVERELQKLSVHPTYGLLVRDESTYERDVIAADARHGSCLRRIFPNMDLRMDGNSDGLSVHDYLVAAGNNTEATRRILRRWSNHFERNVRRDSLYKYSPQLTQADPIALGADTGVEWVKLFQATANIQIAFWIEATNKKPKKGELFLTLLDPRVLKAARLIGGKQIVNVLRGCVTRYRIRTYQRSTRICPTYFRVMRRALIMSGSHFSPLLAKTLIQQYAAEEK